MAEIEQQKLPQLINSSNDSAKRDPHAIPLSDPRWQERDDSPPPGKIKIGPIAKITGAGLAALTALGMMSSVSNKDTAQPEPTPIRRAAAAPVVKSENTILTYEYIPPVDRPITKIDPNTIHIDLRTEKGTAKFRRDTTIPELSSSENIKDRESNAVDLASIILNGTPLKDVDSVDITGASLVQGPKPIDENFQNPWWIKLAVQVINPQGQPENTFLYISRSKNAAPYVIFNQTGELENFTGQEKSRIQLNPIKKTS